MLFRNERWARLLIETIYRYRQQGIFLLHAFVIMPEHFHALLTPATTLEKAVQYIKGGFSREAKLRFKWGFPIWQKSFTDHRIRDAQDCDNHIQYIYLNPVKRHLCERPSEYPYSSAHPGFALDELPQRLKPEWLTALDGTAGSRAPSKPEQPEVEQPRTQGPRSAPPRLDESNVGSPTAKRGSEALIIRQAVPTDLSSILKIERASPTAAHWAETGYLKALIQPERLFLVAEEEPNHQILGFLVASTATQEWELENIATSPAARARGIGRALMKALLERARQGGAAEIRQEIRASNMAAQRLGQSNGFIQEGRRRGYYLDPVEDALLFKYLVTKR